VGGNDFSLVSFSASISSSKHPRQRVYDESAGAQSNTLSLVSKSLLLELDVSIEDACQRVCDPSAGASMIPVLARIWCYSEPTVACHRHHS
jgi:hypothetical protein